MALPPPATWLLFALHTAIAILGFVGCISAGLNFGNDYSFPKNGAPIPKPEEVGLYNETEHYNRTNYYAKRRLLYEFKIVLNTRANFIIEPRTYIMIPFLATTVYAALMAVYVILLKNAGTTTLMVNCNIALWLVNFSYCINYVIVFDAHDDALVALTTLHDIMMALLFITIVACGWRLRSNSVRWPACNFVKLFTIGTAFTIAKVVLLSSILPIMTSFLGKGFHPMHTSNPEYCVDNTCGMIGLTAISFFSMAGSVCFLLVLAIENFLSVVWGKVNHRMTIAVELITGIVCLIFYTHFSAIVIYTKYGGKGHQVEHNLVFVACVCLMHGWLLWWCREFITSPPSIVMLLSRGTKNKKSVDNPADTSNIENSNCVGDDEEENANINNVTPSDDEARVILPLNETSTAESVPKYVSCMKHKAFCIPWNILIFVVALFIPSFTGSIMASHSTTNTWPQLLVIAVVPAVAARAFVTILTIAITGHIPTATDLQSLVRLGLETSLVLYAGVTLLVYNDGTSSAIVAGAVTLSLVFIKVLDSENLSAIRGLLHRIRLGRSQSSDSTADPITADVIAVTS